jgi:histidyl-tRNA synthetase
MDPRTLRHQPSAIKLSTVLSTKPPAGTRDFLPDDIRKRQHVMGVIRDVYESYGYAPLETPAFENIETLLGKYGEEGNKLIFKILKRGEHEHTGEADLALRYDLTVPLARVVAQYQNQLPKFFKRYQIQPVWRADRPAKGRFREFYQCDIDSIGSTSPLVEIEQLSAVSDVLTGLGFSDFTIRLNDRRLLAGLMSALTVGPDQQGGVLVAIDKLDKIGAAGVLQELTARGVEQGAADAMLQIFGAPSADFAIIERMLGSDNSALAHLRGIVDATDGTAASGHVRIDPSLARGISYYTGAIMEVAVPDLAGSLGGGGRYDGLVGMFLGRDVPACGFSLGMERIIVVMTERNMFPASVAGAGVDIMVTVWNEASQAGAVRLASLLRRGGLRVELYPEPDKLGKQFKYASSRNVPFVAIEGDDERASGTIAIKDLRSGEQTSIARAEAVGFVERQLGTKN